MKHYLLFFALTTSILLNAQDYNKWSLGLNAGSHDGMHYTTSFTKAYQFDHYNGHIRYMHNNRFGWKFDMAYDRFDFINGTPSTNLLRFSIQPVINLTDVLNMNDFSKRFGALLHFGAGYSSMFNNKLAFGPDLIFKPSEGAVDEILHMMVGLTPQFKVNERVSLNMDVAMMGHIRQQRTFDFQPNQMSGGGFSGYYWNLSLGATYYIGKHKTHADWTYTPRLNQEDLNRIATLEKQAKEAAAKLADDDKDGVINAVDQEANTPAGSIVDVTGKTIPPVVAPDLMSIDTDGDGFVDGLDECPTVKGTVKGCPEEHSPEKDAKTLVDYGILDVMFVKGSYYLNPTYYSILDKVVSYMAEHPGQKIGVSGHADIDGADELNNKLSEARVNIVVDYLVNKGANKSRLDISYKGKKETKYTGNTEEIDAANRRVQFSIVR